MMQDTAESFVEYHIILDYDVQSVTQNVIESNVRLRLESMKKTYEEFLHFFFTHSYIWQLEPFALHLWIPSDDSSPNKDNAKLPFHRTHFASIPHLYGITHFGENLTDEWFIVFLLLRLSLQFSQLSVHLSDSDGDFLSIEAAMIIPDWLTPETSLNRVWIRAGAIHAVPPDQCSDELLSQNPLSALQLLSSTPPSLLTQASPQFQQIIARRTTQIFPEALAYGTPSSVFHRARCILPIRIAYLLWKHSRNPSKTECFGISAAIRAFCSRGMAGTVAASRMNMFLPIGSDGERKKEEFVSLVVTFSKCQYAQMMYEPFVPPKCFPEEDVPEGHPKRKEREIGMKLACAYEILYQQYVKSEELEKKEEIERVLKGFEEEKKEFVEEVQRESERNNVDDDEKWMEMDGQRMESFVAQVEGRARDQKKGEKSQGKRAEEMFEEMVGDMQEFMQTMSGVEGVEPKEKKRGVGVEFDPDKFLSVVRETLGLEDEQADESEEEEEVEVQADEEMRVHLMKNVLASLEAQEGMAGPASNLFGLLKEEKQELWENQPD